jgi:DNA-binding SARP family transcriptional activator
VVSADTPTDANGQRLADLAHSPHYAVAFVCPHGHESDQATITLDDTGQLTLADCPLTIAARRLDAADGLVITDLLETAATGEDITDPELAEPMVGTAPAADIVLIAPSTETPSLTSASLMAELDVLVKVIGEVEAVRLSADDQPLRPDKQKALEAVAYLAARDAAVPLEDVQAALWPSGANSTKTFRNAITSARSMLGEDRDGQPLLPIPESGRYDLSNRVATDYELFHELIHHADLLDDSQVQLVTTLLTDALSLVRGEPYVGAGRNYAWVAQHRGIIVAEIVNAAEELAEITLELGDWRAAEWAARQGLRAFPCDERLYRVLMRAAHASGSISGVHRVFDELCQVVADPDHGAEPEDTVHPETVSLLEALTAGSTPSRATA